MAATGEHSSVADSDGYELHDNVAVDLINYVRSNTIRNEQQFLLLSFAYASGLFANTHDYVSSVTIGTSSSGKSHLKDKVDHIYGKLNVLNASTGTDKALIYDDGWDEADIISMGELQQPPEEMLEFLKRAHGGDEEVVIKSTRGNPASGFETVTIRKQSKAYHMTFAQFEADFEFWNRLLKIPVHESESKNRAVGRMVAGHENIHVGDGETEYGYPFPTGTQALREHMASVKQHAPKRVVLPTGDEFGWDVWAVVAPIFNHSRSEVNRIYSMVFNIIKASALLNYKHRERTTTTVTEGDDVYEKEALVLAPQDVANVMRCLRALRATTHEIDHKKRAIVEAIKAKSGPDNAIEGVGPISEFLKESDAPEVKASELDAILGDLEDNFLIEINEGAGGDSGKDVYRAFEWDRLGRPNIDAHASLFEDCVDPIDGGDFLSAWSEQRSAIEATADSVLGEASATTTVQADDGLSTTDDGDASLGSWDDTPTEQTYTVSPWTKSIHERISPVLDGKRIPDMQDVPVEAFLGLVSLYNPELAGVDTTGTMLDPDHEVWDQTHKPDEWVTTETDARQQFNEAVSECITEGIITFDEVHDELPDGTPVDVTLDIVAPDEVTTS